MTPELKSQARSISNGIASLHREKYGRGADRVRTIIQADSVATLLVEPFTPAERLMIDTGDFRQVRELRTTFQDLMRQPFTTIVEEATGRQVAAFFSQSSAEPRMCLEYFVLAPVNGDSGLGVEHPG
jgi:uncharacterized protein YbcI